MLHVREITVDSLKQKIDNGDTFRLIDVRTEQEYQQGMIENGELIPLDILPNYINSLKQEDNIIFYCRSGQRSANACLFLEQNTGVTAHNLVGGIIRWNQSDYPIIRPK